MSKWNFKGKNQTNSYVHRRSCEEVAQKPVGILVYFQDSMELKTSLCIWPTEKMPE